MSLLSNTFFQSISVPVEGSPSAPVVGSFALEGVVEGGGGGGGGGGGEGIFHATATLWGSALNCIPDFHIKVTTAVGTAQCEPLAGDWV